MLIGAGLCYTVAFSCRTRFLAQTVRIFYDRGRATGIRTKFATWSPREAIPIRIVQRRPRVK